MLSSQVRAPAGVAGGRRRRSRTKIAVISIKGTKTRHTRKPRNQTAHSERRWLARHSTAEHSREEQIDLDRASQIEIERPNETREQTRNSTKGSGRKTRTDTAAGRPSDAKRFADTKSREFRKPEPAAAAAVHTHTHAHTHTDLSRRRRRRRRRLRRRRCRAPRSYSYLERRTGEREVVARSKC